MKLCYTGNIQTVITNLQNLGADISFRPTKDCSGIIITDDTSQEQINQYTKDFPKIPIILSGKPWIPYSNVKVLVLDEDETKVFYDILNIKTLQECKDKLKELKIHYLVVALTKKQIEKHVKYNLPKVRQEEVKITNEQVATAKDNLTALVGYIYSREGTLSAEAINRANVGAALSVVGLAEEDLKDYYLDIKFKKE